MKVTINLTKQEAIEALLQFYKHTGATEIVISDEQVETDDGCLASVVMMTGIRTVLMDTRPLR